MAQRRRRDQQEPSRIGRRGTPRTARAARAGSTPSPRPWARRRRRAGTGARARRPSRCTASAGRGRADHVQLTAARAWAEHVAGIHRSFGCPGADDVVQFVDEQQDPALGGRTSSAAPARSRSSNSPRYFAPATSSPMSREKMVRSRRPRGRPVDDALGQALDDGGLADSGSPRSTGLFFDFRDRIWTTRRISASRPITGSSRRAGRLHQVHPVLRQGLRRTFRGRGGDRLVAAYLRQRPGRRRG